MIAPACAFALHKPRGCTCRLAGTHTLAHSHTGTLVCRAGGMQSQRRNHARGCFCTPVLWPPARTEAGTSLPNPYAPRVLSKSAAERERQREREGERERERERERAPMADVRVEAVAVVRERARAALIQLRPAPRSWISILHVNLQVVTAAADISTSTRAHARN